MADKTIGELPNLPAISPLDLLVAQHNEEATKITGATLTNFFKDYIGPVAATSASQMTNTNKVYIYIGNESGYTNGNWYYYNGSSWVSGGAYNSQAVNTDATLTHEGVAADAEAAGKIVEISETQPAAPANRVWIPETQETAVQVPTWAEHEELVDDISDLNGAITTKLPHLESTGDNTDRLAEINAALAQGGCVLGEGTFHISDTIVMPNNTSLIGCGVNTVVSLVYSAANKSAIKMAQYNTVESLKIAGNKAPSATVGNVHGIEWSGDYSTSENEYTQPRVGKISNVYIDGFSGGGIYCYNTGYATYTNLNVDNVTISSCAVGIYIPYWSEYHKFTNVQTWNCYYGCINNGGNNSFVNCDFSGSKEVGFKMENPNDANPNNTHGMCVGCLFNHIKNNSGNAVAISDTHNGFAFVGCQFFYGNVSISNTSGIVFDGCTFGVVSITVTGTGKNIFSNNTFSSQPTLSVTSATVFDNCYERTNNTGISPFVKNGSISVISGVTATVYNAVAKQVGNIVSITGWFYCTATSIGTVQDILNVTGVDMPPTPPGGTYGYLRGTLSYGNYAYDLTDVCYFILENNKLRITPQATGQKAYVFNIVYMI